MLLLDAIFSWRSDTKLLSDKFKALLILEGLYLVLELLQSDLLPARA
jgi:hypothetical protein